MDKILQQIISIAGSEIFSTDVLDCFDVGKMRFKECADMQDKLQKLRISKKINNIMLIVEHPPVYTVTKHTNLENILLPENQLRAQGIDIEPVDRGGDVTFHGPGQIVCYPIFDIRNYKLNVRNYVGFLQNLVIHTLENIGIKAEVDHKAPGVWVNRKKIAALGVRITRFVTKHGLALNNDVDLKFFENIIPCGLKGKEVTSIKRELSQKFERNEIIPLLLKSVEKILNVSVILHK